MTYLSKKQAEITLHGEQFKVINVTNGKSLTNLKPVSRFYLNKYSKIFILYDISNTQL
ncbi:hypothetical protein MADA3029_60105 [Vibrio nigripulchritudo MADA3029]|nr:hypothetical protein VIBNIMADA3020_290107 [Vibrio nigripulchritudo MADA3020]CCN51003.1 hypothetical protein VIBNIMADA3021_10107 [Vibrio nigripulchritudo MADA3021]CCN60521.1 hypothetical protein MADA3029_60105 [Vibrio nigripulchritudo MADA3029]